MADSKPVPDPTLLSQQLVDKEIKHLRELLESRMKGTDSLIEEQFASHKAATERVDSLAAEQRNTLGARIDGLKERLDRSEGRLSGQTAIIASLITIATFVLGLLVYLRH